MRKIFWVIFSTAVVLIAIRLLPKALRREAQVLEMFTTLLQTLLASATGAIPNTAKTYANENRISAIEVRTGNVENTAAGTNTSLNNLKASNTGSGAGSGTGNANNGGITSGVVGAGNTGGADNGGITSGAANVGNTGSSNNGGITSGGIGTTVSGHYHAMDHQHSGDPHNHDMSHAHSGAPHDHAMDHGHSEASHTHGVT